MISFNENHLKPIEMMFIFYSFTCRLSVFMQMGEKIYIEKH